MLLALAESRAHKIVLSLAPFCARIEIAGSIRRRRPIVGDIDLVILPREGHGQREAIQALCRRNGHVVTEGPQNSIYRYGRHDDGHVQLDIFFATHPETTLLETTPGNWGSLFLCRTGSREHNIYLASRALRLGKKWNPYKGVYHGPQLLASETEDEIFAALDLPFIPPERRS